MKKILSAIFLLSFVVVCLTGCRTLKGMKEDVQKFPEDASKGAAATGEGIMKADAWIRENMW